MGIILPSGHRDEATGKEGKKTGAFLPFVHKTDEVVGI
jgi:hypothetical protein